MRPLVLSCPAGRSVFAYARVPVLLMAAIALPIAAFAQTSPALPAARADAPLLQLTPRTPDLNFLQDTAPPAPGPRRIQYRVGYGPSSLAANGSTYPAQCNSPQLTYFGGPVISNAQVVAVFWSSNVNPTIQQNIGTFFQGLTNSSWYDTLSEYATNVTPSGGQGGTNQSIGRGSYQGSYTIVPVKCAGTTTCTVTDADIQTELTRQIGLGVLPAQTYDSNGNTNTIYMTYFPPNVHVSAFGSSSCVQFCAYHNTGGSIAQPLLYGVMMDQFTSACSTGCGNSSVQLQNQESTSSHELAEAVTDAEIGLDTQNNYAYPAGWGDNNNSCGETGDICDSGSVYGVPTPQGTQYVQPLWSNAQAACVINGIQPKLAFSAPSTVAAGSPFAFTLTVSNPGHGTDIAFVGTVHFTSSDPSATLPSDYTFTPTDQGTATFNATLATGTSQTITATDTVNSAITATTTYPLSQTVNVTVGTSPAGLAFSVDNTPYTSNQTFTWNVGAQHTIATTATQPTSPGVEATFTAWSDSGALSHIVTASSSQTSYIATFGAAFQLNLAPNNGAWGSVSPASGNYYSAIQVVPILATPAGGHRFTGWTGSSDIATPSSASTTVTMNAVETLTANFAAGCPNPNPNPNSAASTVPGDFNGDCKSDILWRNSNSLLVYTWLMNGTSIASQGGLSSASSAWVIRDVGDFDGNGMGDILWRNSTTGEVYVWFLNGNSIASQASLGTIPADWVIQGVGDFNGDGKSDILWRNSTTGEVYLWMMNGATIASQASLGNIPTDWVIEGVGDFDGDGKADILWRNSTSQLVYIWIMNGLSIASQGAVSNPTSDWVIQGTGDFDGDGRSDILWRNSTSGQVYVWLMNGTSIASQGSPSTASLDWVIQGTGDFNGDGRSDILWRSSTSGEVYVWFMSGSAIGSQGGVNTVSSDWQIVE
jgi:hypothetical protein